MSRLSPFLSLSGALALLALAAPANAQDWTVDREASSVGFETEAFGSTTRGEFPDWSAEITLDPANLETARIRATVMTASGSTGNGQIDDSMLSATGLAPDSHASASFYSEQVVPVPNGYVANGSLTIRGQSQDAILAFSLEIEGNRAIADGQIDIARADFGVGDASWGEIASEVRIIVHIEADAAD